MIVSVALAACFQADAQSLHPGELLATLEDRLAMATLECAIVNEARSRLCIRDQRLTIAENQLTRSQELKTQVARDKYKDLGYLRSIVRIDLIGERSITVDPMLNPKGEQRTFRVSLRCGPDKCVNDMLNGDWYESMAFSNLDSEVSAKAIASLLDQLIVACKVPNACR
jgi:hypothetical protein